MKQFQNGAVGTEKNRSRFSHGTGLIWDRNSSKIGPAFFCRLKIGPKPHQIGGTDSRSRVNRRPIRTDFLTGTVSCEHSLSHAWVAHISKSLETYGYTQVQHYSLTVNHITVYRAVFT